MISLVLDADWSFFSVVIDSQSTKLVYCDWPVVVGFNDFKSNLRLFSLKLTFYFVGLLRS